MNQELQAQLAHILQKGAGPAMTRRQEDNRAILRLLTEAVESQPDSRFGQILVNLDVIQIEPPVWARAQPKVKDPFYEEPGVTLNRMVKTVSPVTTDSSLTPSGNLRIR